MRGILSKILIAGTLLSGGIASADGWRSNGDGHEVGNGAARDHRDDDGAPAVRHDRDDDAPPAPRVERQRERRGQVWIAGQWTRRENGRGRARWVWTPGHYERVARHGNGRY